MGGAERIEVLSDVKWGQPVRREGDTVFITETEWHHHSQTHAAESHLRWAVLQTPRSDSFPFWHYQPGPARLSAHCCRSLHCVSSGYTGDNDSSVKIKTTKAEGAEAHRNPSFWLSPLILHQCQADRQLDRGRQYWAGAWLSPGRVCTCPETCLPSQPSSLIAGLQERNGKEGSGSVPPPQTHTHTHTHISTACQFSILKLWYDRCCVQCNAAVPWARLLRLLDPKWSFQKRKKYSQHLSAQRYTWLLPNRRGGWCKKRCGAERQWASQNRPGVRLNQTSTVYEHC